VKSTDVAYQGLRQCLSTMIKEEGPRSLFRGASVAAGGAFLYTGINLSVYEFLRPALVIYRTNSSDLGHPSVPGQLLCASIASIASQSVAFPFDVVRRRMQVQSVPIPSSRFSTGSWHPTIKFPVYRNSWQGFRQAYDSRHLYRGWLANTLKVLPASCISFMVYERVRNHEILWPETY